MLKLVFTDLLSRNFGQIAKRNKAGVYIQEDTVSWKANKTKDIKSLSVERGFSRFRSPPIYGMTHPSAHVAGWFAGHHAINPVVDGIGMHERTI